jgi:hypothetical protein
MDDMKFKVGDLIWNDNHECYCYILDIDSVRFRFVYYHNTLFTKTGNVDNYFSKGSPTEKESFLISRLNRYE